MIADIQRLVAAHYGFSVEHLRSPERPRMLSHVRWVAMYLARTHTKKSLTQIGRAFRRDHTTVLHGLRSIEQRKATDPKFAEELAGLSAKCAGCEDARSGDDLESIVEQVATLVRRHLQINPAALIAFLKAGPIA